VTAFEREQLEPTEPGYPKQVRHASGWPGFSFEQSHDDSNSRKRIATRPVYERHEPERLI
jgi:hypothetical protein